MSIKIMTMVFSAKVGSATRKLILLKLADNADDSGRCWPSQKYLTEACEISERSLRDHLKRLEEDGFITAIPKHENGMRVGTEYTINIDALQETKHARQILPVDRQISPSLPAESAATPRQNLPPNRHIEPSENHHIPPTSWPPQGGDGRALAKQGAVKRQGTFFENSEYRGVVPEEWIAWAVSRGMPRSRAFMAAEAFQDYWIAATGEKARKRDWFATWRNWVRREMQSGARRSGDDFSPRAFMDLAREAYEEAERVVREESGNGK